MTAKNADVILSNKINLLAEILQKINKNKKKGILIMPYDLGTATREQLIEIAKKVYVEEPNKLGTEDLRKAVYENKKHLENIQLQKEKYYKDTNREDLKEMLNQYNIEFTEENLNNQDYSIIMELQTKLSLEEMIKKSESAMEFQVEENQDVDMSLSDAKYYLEKLNKTPAPKDVQSDEFRQHNNIRTGYKNVIRQKFGLPIKPITYTNSDLESLLLLDNMTLGENVQEFLKSVESPSSKEKYKRRMEEICNLHNTLERQKRDEEKYLYEITMEFERIKNVPKKTIIDTAGKLQVNESYENWIEELKKFHRKLSFKEKGLIGEGQGKVPEKFKEILSNINELYKKHIKE